MPSLSSTVLIPSGVRSEFLGSYLQLLVTPDGLGVGSGFLSGQPAVGLASGYLHRSGDLGRSHPRRWTHTARAASAGAAGRRSTPGHWNTWSTEAGRLLRTGLGERKGKL